MSHMIELDEFSEEQLSSTSSYGEHDGLLVPYSDARAYETPACFRVVWERLKHEVKQVVFPSAVIVPKRIASLLYATTLVFFGVFISTITIAFFRWKATDPFDAFFAHFWDEGSSSAYKPAKYPIEFFGSVLPIPCHSHNDYWRRTPLFAALGSGCISIEADIFYRNNDIFVGHVESALHADRTLESMYINRLVDLLDGMNPPRWKATDPKGVFYNAPKQSLTLVIDFKTAGKETWSTLHEQLQPLRERGWLTHWNGTHRVERPLTIVASGAADFDLVAPHGSVRDIFFDAPLDELDHPFDDGTRFRYNVSNSHLASVNFHSAIGPVFRGKVTDEQLLLMRKHIQSAKQRGLVSRYWGTPRWPRGRRDEIWALLVQENIGLLNVDDLRGARKGSWGSWS
ncbi:hypothetical protein PMIN06_010883 [Paraphaeosphaeria minitans]|uniref:Altered inheritance of mitochondria protein 6 n=1 Tax=Paraphaeosphaeria minitans TaxID=565426 RepID=A0A9P6KQQ3_9PLEO|nr:hypothetical protein PMIN01_06760 [Paraphaeosphaeria minitans]